MTTLAKRFLEAHKSGNIFYPGKSSKVLLEMQEWTSEFVVSRLKAPSPDENMDRTQCAERFVFEEDAPILVNDLIDGGSVSRDLVWETLRMPSNSFWIEFPITNPDERSDDSDLDSLGFMVGMVPRNDSSITSYRLMMAVVASNRRERVRPVCLLTLPETPVLGKSSILLHWYLDALATQKKEDIDVNDATVFVDDMIACLFLINTPRVSEHRSSTFGSARKVRRGEPEPMPLIEYKRVVMKVGVGQPRYDRNASGGGQFESEDARHRRLHRVIGHFRTYREGREKPHVSFVPQHWRGDASLGILLHERVVKR